MNIWLSEAIAEPQMIFLQTYNSTAEVLTPENGF